MSERMSSVEIEDVLSSIRRLVSEDLRPMQRPKPRVEAGNKLILTPALRVVPQDGDSESEVPPSSAFDQNEADFLTENVETTRASEDSELSSPLQSLLDHIAHGDMRMPEHEAVLPDPAEASVATPASIEAVVAVLGAAVTGQGWDGDQENAPAPSVDWSDQVWADRALADVAYPGFEEQAEEEAEEIAAATASPDPWSSDEIWMQARDAGVSESSFIEDEDTAAPPMPFSETEIADLAEAAAVAEIMSAGSAIIDETAEVLQDDPGADHDRESLFREDIQELDEDALRDMVRDILRQELQGDLGERITRNVRKLVRAEINRVLTSRDFE